MPSPINNGSPTRRFQNSRSVRSTADNAQPRTPPPSQDVVDLSSEARGGKVAGIDEHRESELLRKFANRSGLVKVYDGHKKGVHVTIHGIRGNPDLVKPLSQDSASKGQDVYTLVYDDNHQRLDQSSQGLADSLRGLQRKHPGEEITLRSHSMGSRVGVDALRKLNESGDLKGSVKMENFGPVFGGFASANTASLAPGPMAKWIPGAAPGKDMGTLSGFQRRLEATTLPKNVTTTNYVGSNDTLVNPGDKHFQRVQDGLNATTRIVPGADHDSILTEGRR